MKWIILILSCTLFCFIHDTSGYISQRYRGLSRYDDREDRDNVEDRWHLLPDRTDRYREDPETRRYHPREGRDNVGDRWHLSPDRTDRYREEPRTRRYHPRDNHKLHHLSIQEEPYREDPETPRYHPRYEHRERERHIVKDDFFPELERERESMLIKETKKKLEQKQIEQCEIDMENCPFSAEELVDKILAEEDDEWKKDLSNEEYRPILVVDSIESLKVPRSDVESIMPQPSIMPSRRKLKAFGRREKNNIPRYCRPNCVRQRLSGRYKIDCRNFLKDRSIRYFYQRKRKMVSCYKCRNACSSANVNIYI